MAAQAAAPYMLEVLLIPQAAILVQGVLAALVMRKFLEVFNNVKKSSNNC